MNNRNSSREHSKKTLSYASLNAVCNKDRLILKINPRHQIQTRPYTSSEYKRLKDSIDEIGQDQPIIIDEDGYILDVHHRLKVCEELSIKPWVEIRSYASEEQKIEAINQLNLARRHCSRWELYMAAERMRPEFEAEVRDEQELKCQKGKKGIQPIGVKFLC
jgi:ParB-like chromosome segregation protein Spo0J